MINKFYEYSQNNPGGFFDVDDKVCHRLFIEADNRSDAEKIALSLGVYFTGCEDGLNCDCCGDRWYNYPYELVFPYGYGDIVFETVTEYAQYLADTYGMTAPACRVFYKSGEVVNIYTKGTAE